MLDYSPVGSRVEELTDRVLELLAAERLNTLEGYDSFVLSYRMNDGDMQLLSGPLRLPE